MKNFNLLLVILLLILAVYMIYLGIKAGILPPTLTGIGFILIAALFFNKEENR